MTTGPENTENSPAHGTEKDEKGFAPPHYYDYNDFGREAQRVYDDIYFILISNKKVPQRAELRYTDPGDGNGNQIPVQ